MTFISKTLKKLFTPGLLAGQYDFARFFFIRLMALVYFFAFASLYVQITGLVGEDGILPATQYLQRVQQILGAKSFVSFPTIFWLGTSDVFLQAICLFGMILSALVFLGFFQAPLLAIAWLFYLSLVHIAQVFTHFQWDSLLLETGFIAIFFAPLNFYTSFKRASPPSRWILLLLNWLLLRLMLSAGLVKLFSHDPTWWGFTALSYHYETQPIPNTLSWYAHQLPVWFQMLCTGLALFIETVIPIFILLSRRLRLIAALSFILLMILIMATGNYGFFNLCTIALCLTLIDDDYYKKILPKKILEKFNAGEHKASQNTFKKYALATITILIFSLSLIPFSRQLFHFRLSDNWLRKAYHATVPFYLTNTYGLFAVMTTTRPEIIVEGSQDGINWQAYEFKWQAGQLNQAPRNVIPHMPRLDWQMWFAALSNYQRNPWFTNFLTRLLQGKPEVIKLLKHNPFPNGPPRFIRSKLYLYNFTNFQEKRSTGDWWKREFVREYTPVVELQR